MELSARQSYTMAIGTTVSHARDQLAGVDVRERPVLKPEWTLLHNFLKMIKIFASTNCFRPCPHLGNFSIKWFYYFTIWRFCHKFSAIFFVSCVAWIFSLWNFSLAILPSEELYVKIQHFWKQSGSLKLWEHCWQLWLKNIAVECWTFF